jgi:hypothetical protein
MVVVVIISIIATMTLFTLFGVMENAKEARTRSQIAKLHELIMTKWESYRTRAIPVVIPATALPRVAAQQRLAGMRELMRMELPERKTDLIDSAVILVKPGSSSPLQVSLWRTYRRKAGALVKAKHTTPTNPTPDWKLCDTWTPELQGAECLYLIVSVMRDGDSNGLDFFKESEIQDTDDDGIPEIVDGWGRPIEFLRWAPGFVAVRGNDGAWGVLNVDDDGVNGTDDLGERGWPNSDDELVSDIHDRDASKSPDPFDPLKVDPRWGDNDPNNNPYNPSNDPFALYPVIYSAGRDQLYGISTDYDTDPNTQPPPCQNYDRFRYSTDSQFPNDPYHVFTLGGAQSMFGLPDKNGIDNITNHALGVN